jgi:hypothetical protein
VIDIFDLAERQLNIGDIFLIPLSTMRVNSLLRRTLVEEKYRTVESCSCGTFAMYVCVRFIPTEVDAGPHAHRQLLKYVLYFMDSVFCNGRKRENLPILQKHDTFRKDTHH